MIPINWYGFHFNTWLQRITWPLFIVGIVALVSQVFSRDLAGVEWGGAITASSLLPAVAVCIPVLTIQGLLVGDWSRFARPGDTRKVQVIASSVAIGGVFLVEAPLGAFMAVVLLQDNPGVYAVTELGVWGALWVVITQIRIQNMNYYSSSLALANFFARVFRFAPGRQFWVLVTAVITFIATVSGILDHLLDVLTFCGTFLLAWAGTLVAGIVAGPKTLGVDLDRLEYRRGYLRNWGWPALAGLATGTAVGAALVLGELPNDTYGAFLGQVLAFVLGFVTYVGAALALRGRWTLLSREVAVAWEDSPDATVVEGETVEVCVACTGTFIRQDMIPCPVDMTTAVCSVCAAKDHACHPDHKRQLFPEGLI
jgi:purine-cytosine permease-like protein